MATATPAAPLLFQKATLERRGSAAKKALPPAVRSLRPPAGRSRMRSRLNQAKEAAAALDDVSGWAPSPSPKLAASSSRPTRRAAADDEAKGARRGSRSSDSVPPPSHSRGRALWSSRSSSRSVSRGRSSSRSSSRSASRKTARKTSSVTTTGSRLSSLSRSSSVRPPSSALSTTSSSRKKKQSKKKKKKSKKSKKRGGGRPVPPSPRRGPVVKLLRSLYAHRPPTLFAEYPSFLSLERCKDDVITKRLTSAQAVRFKIADDVWVYNSVLHALKAAGMRQTSGKAWSILWARRLKLPELMRLNRFQRVNHFPGSWAIGRKDQLARNCQRMARRYPSDFNFLPQTYMLPAEYEAMHRHMNREPRAVFILKPNASSCGRGIRLFCKSRPLSIPRGKSCVVSRYVPNPLLIRRHKFDLRIYVLMTSADPLRLYLFDDGLVRFCTQPYSLKPKTFSNTFSHLTNYSVNKKAAGYVRNNDGGGKKSASSGGSGSGAAGGDGTVLRDGLDEDDDVVDDDDDDADNDDDAGGEEEGEGADEGASGAHKWSLKRLRVYFREHGVDDVAVMNSIKDVIIKTLIAGDEDITSLTNRYCPTRSSCFELLGFDILLDSKLKPWLLEVNTAPSLSSSSPLDKRIKSTLLSDVVHMLGVVPFDARKLERQEREEKMARLLGRAPRTSLRTAAARARRRDPDSLAGLTFDDLSDDDKDVIFESEDEFSRRGHFTRIYPTEGMDYYAPFFPTQRYNNALLYHWLHDWSQPAEDAALPAVVDSAGDNAAVREEMEAERRASVSSAAGSMPAAAAAAAAADVDGDDYLEEEEEAEDEDEEEEEEEEEEEDEASAAALTPEVEDDPYDYTIDTTDSAAAAAAAASAASAAAAAAAAAAALPLAPSPVFAPVPPPPRQPPRRAAPPSKLASLTAAGGWASPLRAGAAAAAPAAATAAAAATLPHGPTWADPARRAAKSSSPLKSRAKPPPRRYASAAAATAAVVPPLLPPGSSLPPAGSSRREPTPALPLPLTGRSTPRVTLTLDALPQRSRLRPASSAT